MKKALYILLVFGIIVSCGKTKTVISIDQFVTRVDMQTDLTYSISEYIIEDLNGEIVGGTDVYELTNENDEIFRIIVDEVTPNKNPVNYTFYFENKKLIYSKIIKFDESGTDTIINSEYYFKGAEMIKQVNKHENGIEPEEVRQLSDFYLVYGKDELE